MFDWVQQDDDYWKVVNTLKNGWQMPSPELFVHWYHSEVHARGLKKVAEREQDVADILFKRMKDNCLDETLADFIGEKQWFPNSAANDPIPVLPNIVKSPRTPPSRRYKNTPHAPRKSKSPKCHKCHKVGHIRRTCPAPNRRRN
jgi:hypothetical protein